MAHQSTFWTLCSFFIFSVILSRTSSIFKSSLCTCKTLSQNISQYLIFHVFIWYGRCTEADLTGTLYLSNMKKVVLKYALCLICLENFRESITDLLEKKSFLVGRLYLLMSLYLKNNFVMVLSIWKPPSSPTKTPNKSKTPNQNPTIKTVTPFTF